MGEIGEIVKAMILRGIVEFQIQWLSTRMSIDLAKFLRILN